MCNSSTCLPCSHRAAPSDPGLSPCVCYPQIELTYWDGNSIGEAQLLQLPRSTAERVTIRALRGGSLALQATHAQVRAPTHTQTHTHICMPDCVPVHMVVYVGLAHTHGG